VRGAKPSQLSNFKYLLPRLVHSSNPVHITVLSSSRAAIVAGRPVVIGAAPVPAIQMEGRGGGDVAPKTVEQALNARSLMDVVEKRTQPGRERFGRLPQKWRSRRSLADLSQTGNHRTAVKGIRGAGGVKMTAKII
jgi:hypothetical protein